MRFLKVVGLIVVELWIELKVVKSIVDGTLEDDIFAVDKVGIIVVDKLEKLKEVGVPVVANDELKLCELFPAIDCVLDEVVEVVAIAIGRGIGKAIGNIAALFVVCVVCCVVLFAGI